MNQNIQSAAVVFVFGSNQAGRHGKGAALHARRYFAARYGDGEGPSGRAYAIPTKDADLRVLPLEIIKEGIQRFIVYAREHPHLTFLVTAVGCGHAGFRPEDIAPLFHEAPENCFVSPRFLRH